MFSSSSCSSIKPVFKRKIVTLSPPDPKINHKFIEECTALVINSSHKMAKEITFSLTLKMPNCSIMYAPTLQLARWILSRRKIDLVVSEAVLPDGGVTGLMPDFEKLENRPDLVVVGNVSMRAAQSLGKAGYHFSSLRHLGHDREGRRVEPVVEEVQNIIDRRVKELGAGIRNDLNNPLQEIVAMVFVARATGGAAPTTIHALEAIDRAAHGLATKIRGLEERIREAVAS